MRSFLISSPSFQEPMVVHMVEKCREKSFIKLKNFNFTNLSVGFVLSPWIPRGGPVSPAPLQASTSQAAASWQLQPLLAAHPV